MSEYNWPSASTSVSISAIGTNGATAPTTSIEVGGIDANSNLQGIKVGTDGTQYVILAGTSAITGHVIVDSGTISQIAAGTISSVASGTVTLNGTPPVAVASGTLGLVSSLASGTVTISGTPAVAISGTIPVVGAVTVSSGTISSISSGTVTISGTPAISGTVTANGQSVVVSGTVTSATNVFAAQDVSAYSAVALQLTFTGTATVTFQASNDNSTFISLSMSSIAGSGACSQVALSNSMWICPVEFKYFRPVVTSYSSGTITGCLVALSSAVNDPGLRSVAITNTVPVTLASGTISSLTGTPAVKLATSTVGTITEGAVTVGTAAVQATVSGSAPAATRTVLMVTPDYSSTAKFYIGSSAVTPTGTHRGTQLVGGQTFIANYDAGAYYICSDTAAQTVYIVEQA